MTSFGGAPTRLTTTVFDQVRKARSTDFPLYVSRKREMQCTYFEKPEDLTSQIVEQTFRFYQKMLILNLVLALYGRPAQNTTGESFFSCRKCWESPTSDIVLAEFLPHYNEIGSCGPRRNYVEQSGLRAFWVVQACFKDMRWQKVYHQSSSGVNGRNTLRTPSLWNYPCRAGM